MQPSCGGSGPAVLVSIHDVMPSTLARVLEIVAELARRHVHPLTLLIVPGRRWSSAQIDTLKKLQDAGVQLAGHGWHHGAAAFASPWHRLHGRLFSRMEAEHLALPARIIRRRVEQSHAWFGSAGLEPPRLYVPPCWAMGALPRRCLQRLPYRFYENFFGIYDARRRCFKPMGVCGYMADSSGRVRVLRAFNRLQRAAPYDCMRIAIHPEDLHLPLAADLAADLRRFARFVALRHALAR